MDHHGRLLLPSLAFGVALLVAGCTSSERHAEPDASASPSPSAASRFLYQCAATVFDPAVLEAPEGLERDDPELRDLVDSLQRSRPHTVDGWRIVAEYGGVVHAMALRPGRGYVSATFERSGDEWTPDGFEECDPEVEFGRESFGTWKLAEEPAPGDTELVVVAHEYKCSGGRRLTQRNTTPLVSYTEEVITIVLRVAPPRDVTCPDNPPSRLTIELDEPVGDRELIDAAVYPPERRYP
jgi:hypothetical protein